MHASMKQIATAVGFTFVFSLSTVEAAEFPPLRATHVAARQECAESPYAQSRGATLVARQQPAATLVQRQPVQLGPQNALPIYSSPAREADVAQFPEITALGGSRYAGALPASQYRQVGYAPAASPQVAQIPAYAAPPQAAYYAPAPAHGAPQLAASQIAPPRVVYSPVAPFPSTVVRTDVQVGTGIYGQPVIYRAGQPLRNAWRWLTP
jgi:hypothetical protein